MNHLTQMLAGGVVIMAMTARGDDLGLELQQSISEETVIVSPAQEALAFWDRFKSAFEERTADNFADRFHPFSSLNWNLRLEDGDPRHFQDQTSRGARKALTRSVTHGLREASVDLPLMTWLKDRRSLLADFLCDSLANVDEESLSPNELSYHATERSWWDRLSEGTGLRYGVRPFRTAPYAYAGISFRDAETVYLLANVRYVFRNFDEHKFELSLSVPLTHGYSVDIGAAYEFDRHATDPNLALKLFKKLSGDGIFYVSMNLRHEPAVYAGLSFAL